MTHLITTLLLALSQCKTDTDCELVALALCEAGAVVWCEEK